MSSELKSAPVRIGRGHADQLTERAGANIEFPLDLPATKPAVGWSRGARSAVWLMQIAIALGIGYWIAVKRAVPDTRIALHSAGSLSAIDPAVAVTLAPISARMIERSIAAVGNLHGYDELTLKTKISGRVAKIHHDFADRVAPGELLLEIDPTDLQLAVEQARRSLYSELAKWGFKEAPPADADLPPLPTIQAAKLKADWAKSQLSRLTQLQSRGSVIAEEIEQAKTNALVAETEQASQMLMARAGAATALLKKAELDIALQNSKETKIYVPLRDAVNNMPNLRYTITDRYATEGAWLAAGSDLFRLVIDETLKLRLSIPERDAASVRMGARVEVSTLTCPNPVTGKVVRIGPSVDPMTRTFQIEAEVPNSYGLLKSGGFSKANVLVEEAAAATTVPVSALVTFAGIHKLFLVTPTANTGDDAEELVAKEYRVKLGEQSSQWVEIIEPELPVDAMVITSGHAQLADGSIVRIRQPDADALSPASSPSSGANK